MVEDDIKGIVDEVACGTKKSTEGIWVVYSHSLR